MNTNRERKKGSKILHSFLKFLLFFILYYPFLFGNPFVHAEALFWSQTDWSEGEGSSTTNQYFSGTNISDTGSGGISHTLNGEKFSNLDLESDLTGWNTSGVSEGFDTKSVDFDGTNEYITVADNDSLSFGDGSTDSPFSISTWIYIDSYDSENWDILNKRGTLWEYQLLVLNSTQQVRVNLYGGSGIYIGRNSTATISTGGWYNIVSTYDGGGSTAGLKLYVNGTSSDGSTAAAGVYTAMSNTEGAFDFATVLVAARYADGKIDETSVWDKELSSSEVTEIYNSGIVADLNDHSALANIVSWWRMGEGSDSLASNGTVYDVIGSNNGTAKNTETADAVSNVPGLDILSVTYNTSNTHSSSTGSAEIITSTSTFDFTQDVNVGDTETYTLVAYLYTGSEVISSDAELVVDGSTITTTYTDAGSGWYKLSGTTTGSTSSIAYGVQIKADKTVYVDDLSLYDDPASATLVSNIFDAGLSAQWGVLTFTTSGIGMTTLQVRTDSSSDMSGASDFSTCDSIVSGSDISRNNCITEGDQYIQYKVSLAATEPILTPVFEDFNLRYVINSSPDEGVIPLRIATYNTYLGLGANGSDKNNAIEKHINRVQPDIISLQEMNTDARTLISGSWASDLGYDYVENAVPDNNNYNPSLLSKYPILNSHHVSSAGGGDEFNLRFLFTEIDISSLTTQKKLGVYSIHSSPWCNIAPCEPPNAPNATTQFERAVQFLRLVDDINTTRAANPTMEIIVLGDHNANTSDIQPDSFDSDPGGHGAWFTLGSDITFPVSYGRFPEEHYASVDMVFADAKRLDGEYYTIPLPSSNSAFSIETRLDYIAVSEGVEINGSEVLYSETDSAEGLTKYNSVLSSGDSYTASDHSLVFADISLVVDGTPPSLSLNPLSPDPNSNSKPSFTGTATDADNTVSSVEFQMDGTGGSWTACTANDDIFDEASEDFTCAISIELSSASHVIYIRATDSLSNITADADAETDEFVIFYGGGGQPSAWTSPPTILNEQFAVSINSGEETAVSRIVNLYFNAGSDVKRMAISLSSDFNDAVQEDYSPIKQLDICSKFGGVIKEPACPDGQYTVYVKFYTQYGVASSVFLQKINLVSTSQPATLVATFTKDLQLGSIGSKVKILQQFLNQNGFRLAESGVGSPGNETDYFGILTSTALAKFQETNETESYGLLGEKGYFGSITRDFINPLMSAISSKEKLENILQLPSAIFRISLYRGMQSEDVRRLQKLFATKPEIYPEGLFTGYFGPLTEKAAQRFQLQYGVVHSKLDLGFGVVGPKTRAKLQEVFVDNI